MNKYIPLKELEVYKLARQLSKIAWKIYINLDWRDKKIMGDQFLESMDSIGANISEGYARYHFLDRIKFYYNGRASLAEAAEHWSELLYERQKISKSNLDEIKTVASTLLLKLNNFIESTSKAKERQ